VTSRNARLSGALDDLAPVKYVLLATVIATGAMLAVVDSRRPLYLLLSALCGLGFAVQLSKAWHRGEPIQRRALLCLLWVLEAVSVETDRMQDGTSLTGRVVMLLIAAGAMSYFIPSFARPRSEVGGNSLAHRGTELAILAIGTGIALVAVGRWASSAGFAELPQLCVASLCADCSMLLGGLWVLCTRRVSIPAGHLLVPFGMFVLGTDAVRLLGRLSETGSGSIDLPAMIATLGLLAASLLHPLAAEIDSVPALVRSPTDTRLLIVLPWGMIPTATLAVDAVLSGRRLAATVAFAGLGVVALTMLRAILLVRAAQHRADLDDLTGRLGRQGLRKLLAATAAHGRSAHILLIDLDDFKVVNDAHGHDLGDQLLQAIAEWLAADLPVGAVVSRPGGDEFVVVLAEELDPLPIATWIIERLNDGIEIPGLAVKLRQSIGISRLEPGVDADEALLFADVAMHAAKRAGGNRWNLWRHELQNEVLGPALLQGDLRRLLAGEQGVGKLEVHYQPLVDARTGRLVKVEALIRWRTHAQAMVPPDDFLPAVEQAGLGADLDLKVLRQALSDLAHWQSLGMDGPDQVSVNLGISSLRSPTLATDVLSACVASGIPCGRLVLEITEHEQLAPDPALVRGLTALRQQGIEVALDDFGAGYAALNYLRHWPLDTVKIDRSLLPDKDTGAHAGDPHRASLIDPRRLFTAVIELARQLSLGVTVEGVETAADAELATSSGADHLQGWRFARPMPADELVIWWQEHQHKREPAGELPAPRTAPDEQLPHPAGQRVPTPEQEQA
jgi:diguanylate cyclase (GGDEF)-like protein